MLIWDWYSYTLEIVHYTRIDVYLDKINVTQSTHRYLGRKDFEILMIE